MMMRLIIICKNRDGWDGCGLEGAFSFNFVAAGLSLSWQVLRFALCADPYKSMSGNHCSITESAFSNGSDESERGTSHGGVG